MGKKSTVVRIDPSSAAKIVSLATGALVAIAILLSFAAVAVGWRAEPVIPPGSTDGAGWVIAVAPFIYMIGAYVAVFLFCSLLNFASRLFGGIRIELSE